MVTAPVEDPQEVEEGDEDEPVRGPVVGVADEGAEADLVRGTRDCPASRSRIVGDPSIAARYAAESRAARACRNRASSDAAASGFYFLSPVCFSASLQAWLTSLSCLLRQASARPWPGCTSAQNFWRSPLHSVAAYFRAVTACSS